MLTKFQTYELRTTHLTLNVMQTVARHVGVDINNDVVAEKLYWICCDLESWGSDEGFGSSDHYSYIKAAEVELAAEIEAAKQTESNSLVG